MSENKNIVLLHGWGASIKKLEPLKQELEKKGWDVLLPKLPGFDAPDPKNPWSLEDYSQFVIGLAQDKWASKKYIVFGHSFGGRVAIKMALNKNNNLQAIILCAAGGISRSSLIKRSVFYILAKLGKVFRLFPQVASFWRKVLYKAAREHDYERTNGVMKNTMKNIISEDLKNKISDLDIPVLILWGKKDAVTPYKDAHYLKQQIKNSKLVSFENSGHKLPYEEHQQIAKEIDLWIK